MAAPKVEMQEKIDDKKPQKIPGHILEILADAGEGAQKAGQSLANLSAKMGNGVWTVEIIPSDIQPPPRTRESASGIRIRMGAKQVTNAGDAADLVVAFNEIVPYPRIEQGAYKEGTIFLIENKWADANDSIQKSYRDAITDFQSKGFRVIEIPMEKEYKNAVPGAKKGKNMWVLGMLCRIYGRDMLLAEEQIRLTFKKKSIQIIEDNLALLQAGYNWAADHLDFLFCIPSLPANSDKVVMNGNQALGFGLMAAGIEVCSMYPITPASSISHQLAENFERIGGVIHQAEDEIAAIGFALGASYAGKTAVTITSGPGLALKTEFIGLAVMAELPIIIIDVQRGGPSTGLPTKVEQSDLLSVMYGQPGDTPKVILAPATIEDCFHTVIEARNIADTYRIPVFILSDANLATGVQPFNRPEISGSSFPMPLNQEEWDKGKPPYDWNENSGLSNRPVPGQPGGMYTLTGLAHNRMGKVSYAPEVNQEAVKMRSRKLAAIGATLSPPPIFGESSGDLLIVGWGSTKGAIEEAVERAREQKLKVSAVHLRYLSPMEPGLSTIFKGFKKVKTVEINYSDDIDDALITAENRRYAQLAMVLRAKTLKDIDSYSHVKGLPMTPGEILDMIHQELKKLTNE